MSGIRRIIGSIEEQIEQLYAFVEVIMTQIDDLTAEIAQVKQDAADAAARVAAAQKALADQIAALQAQLAAGTAPDLSAQIAALTDIHATLTGIDPAAPPAAPPA